MEPKTSLDTKFIQIGQAVKIGQRLDESGLEKPYPVLHYVQICTTITITSLVNF